MLWLFLAVVGKLKWVRRRAPSISPIRGSARIWLSDGSDKSDGSDQSDLSKNQYRFVSFRLFRVLSWAKNINRFLTFPLPQTPQSRARKGESEQPPLPARGYNKAVGRFPYCIGGHYKEVHQHNKRTDGEDKDTSHQKRPKKRGSLMKSAPLAGFHATFLFQGNKKGLRKSADCANWRFSQDFRKTASVNFSEDFRNCRTGHISRTSRRFC